MGYHYNLCVEDCARGIILMDELAKKGKNNNDAMLEGKSHYPDLSKTKLLF